MDLPRSAQWALARFYVYLEEIKDGFITATKYQGGTSLFRSPHLVIFANWPPIVEGTLSFDRWDIREIQSDGTMEALSTGDIIEINKEDKEERERRKRQYPNVE